MSDDDAQGNAHSSRKQHVPPGIQRTKQSVIIIAAIAGAILIAADLDDRIVDHFQLAIREWMHGTERMINAG